MNRSKTIPKVCTAGPFKGYMGVDWISSAAQKDRKLCFNNLLHHFNQANLGQAFRQLDGNKAVGIDQITKKEYGKNLEENLEKLADELRRGGWRPRPSREKLIPKPQGGFRPLAIGCLEDKIVQLLMAKVLEAIYEPIFHHHSYGFRPGRNTHQALARLHSVIRLRPENCVVVEMDIEKFFNSMDHELLMEMIGKRISDPHILRLIRRMLRNSILHENGTLSLTERGSPQGAPVSPLLANIYLHSILDEWFDENWCGKGEMVRYADDAVFVFGSEEDASAFKSALQRRLEEYGKIRLNEDKSGMIHFNSKRADAPLPFLGFVLYWGKTHGNPRRPCLKLKTAPKRVGKCIEAFTDWIKATRNRKKLDDIWQTAAAKLRGHFLYYGVTFNEAKLNHFYHACLGSLFRWLNRRSQKRSFTWEKFKRRLMLKPLPTPPRGRALIDITSETGPELKHKPRSRMRELRTSGSIRSTRWQQPVFT